jgi:AcrR family transcriptional regulator
MPVAKSSRRTPRQARSRDRVDAIVEAARELIGQRGNDAVSMREIAARAGVPIASVYDYFADKNAILRQLMLGYMQKIQSRLASILARVETPADLFGAIDSMVDAMVAIFREERELPTIWGAVQANTLLRNLDVEDGRLIAEFLIARFMQVVPDADPEGIRDACIYAVSTVSTTVRMAIYTNPADGERLIREFKTLMRLRLENVMLPAISVRVRST